MVAAENPLPVRRARGAECGVSLYRRGKSSGILLTTSDSQLASLTLTVVPYRMILGISIMTATLPAATQTEAPAFIRRWVDELKPVPLVEVVSDPAATAIFSTDMIVGFCDRGSLASPRVDALTGPVVDLFERCHALGVRYFVLTQDTHDPAAAEFETWP